MLSFSNYGISLSTQPYPMIRSNVVQRIPITPLSNAIILLILMILHIKLSMRKPRRTMKSKIRLLSNASEIVSKIFSPGSLLWPIQQLSRKMNSYQHLQHQLWKYLRSKLSTKLTRCVVIILMNGREILNSFMNRYPSFHGMRFLVSLRFILMIFSKMLLWHWKIA